MRDDSHARLQFFLELRNELQVQARQQIQRDDRCVADAGFEEILVQEADASVGDARRLKIRVGFLDSLRVDIDSGCSSRAEVLDRSDRDSSIAGSEVVHDVALADLRGLQHGLDDLGRCRDEDDVGRPESRLCSERR